MECFQLPSQNRLNIFIIDGNELIRSALRMIIQSDAYNVVGDASSAKAGLEQVERLRPDVICLDAQLPDRNGLDLLEQIKQGSPHTVVLMLTGSIDRETVQTAMKKGANGFIIKPFSTGTVLDCMEKSTAALRAKKMAAGVSR